MARSGAPSLSRGCGWEWRVCLSRLASTLHLACAGESGRAPGAPLYPWYAAPPGSARMRQRRRSHPPGTRHTSLRARRCAPHAAAGPDRSRDLRRTTPRFAAYLERSTLHEVRQSETTPWRCFHDGLTTGNSLRRQGGRPCGALGFAPQARCGWEWRVCPGPLAFSPTSPCRWRIRVRAGSAAILLVCGAPGKHPDGAKTPFPSAPSAPHIPTFPAPCATPPHAAGRATAPTARPPCPSRAL